MICGDDISRIPETSKPDFECNKESAQEEQAEEVSESMGKITNKNKAYCFAMVIQL